MGIIAERTRASLMTNRKPWPVRSNRASEMGHHCERYLYYMRTAWQNKPLPDLRFIEAVEEGKAQERETNRFLTDHGFDVSQQNRPLEYPEHQIAGAIDGLIVPSFPCPEWPTRSDGSPRPLPYEIKSMSPWIWQSINTYDDMASSRYPWVRKYPAQIQLYLLMMNEDTGVLVLKDKTGMRVKDIFVPLDYEYAGALIDRADRINAAMAAGTPPERHETAECGKCDFVLDCEPTVCSGKGAVVLSDTELIELLERRAELEATQREFNALDERIKKMLPSQVGMVIAGDYIIETTEATRKGYEVKAGTYLKRSFSRLGAQEEA